MPGGTILLVDDNAANLKLLGLVLSSQGYDVRTASCAQEAFELLKTTSPRLILIDVQLPDIDGLEVTRRLKADPATREILIIAVTAYAMKGDKEKAISAGCDGYVTKPIDTRALPILIAQYLGEAPAKPNSSPPRFEKEAVAESAREGTPLVLVVEDDPQMNKFLTVVLSRLYRTVSASDGEEGIDKARAMNPDLILSDLMMPRATGEQLLTTLRSESQFDAVPIVLLTGQEDSARRVKLLQQGAQDYIMKPCSTEELEARVGNLLTVKRVRRLLQDELQSKVSDVESLASQLAKNKRQLIVTLDSVQVAREQAEQASKVKTDFLQMVSHELRTPLATLFLEAQRLERTPAIGKSDQVGVKRILRSCKRLSDLIESLLNYSQIESGRLSVSIDELDCEELCRELLEELRTQAENQGLEIRLISAPNLPKLKSDLRLVRLVIVNLLSNAIKFTKQGTVEVAIAYAGGVHRIQVRDTGPGIPEDQQSKVYDPFWHRELVTQKHVPGTGLGLAIVKQLVEALGGSISLDSKPGAGCTFTLELSRYRKIVASPVDRSEDSEPAPSFEAA